MLCNHCGQATKGPFVPLFLQHPNWSLLHTSLSLFPISFIFCSLCHGLCVPHGCFPVTVFILFYVKEVIQDIVGRLRLLYLLQGWGPCLCHLSPLSFTQSYQALSVSIWVYSKNCSWSDNKFLMLFPYKPAIKLRIKSISYVQWKVKNYCIKG